MSAFIAALPMYDWTEIRADVDAQWDSLRMRLVAAGIDAPERLTRRNADMPAVPGGIRDAAGHVIAADPATLPPDELDLAVLWRHPRLLFAQTCWGPLEVTDLAPFVRVVGQPDYSDFEGGDGEFYSSALVMRRGLPSPLRGGSAHGAGVGVSDHQYLPPPGPSGHLPGRAAGLARPSDPLKGEGKDGTADLPLNLLRGKRFAFNSHDSMSGIIALTRDLEAMGETIDIFAKRIETGGHRLSIRAVAEGRADVAAVDCRSWEMARRFEAAAAELEIVGWTAKRMGLPFITARSTPEPIVRAFGTALRDAGMTTEA